VFGVASAAFVTACLIAATPSCGSGFMDGLVGGSRDGGGLLDALDDDGRACQPATAPGRPEGASDDGTNISIDFAMESLRADTSGTVDSGTPPPQGLDFDNACTCPEPETCRRPDGGQRTRACDGDAGRDNAVASFFNQLGVGVPDFRFDFGTKRIADGVFTIFVNVRGWNGKPDDPQVTVSLVMSQGFDDAANGERTRPAFDGNDVWLADQESLLEGAELVGADCRSPSGRPCLARVQDLNAYVRDGALVANLSDPLTGKARVVMNTPLGSLVFDLLETTLVANIREVDGRYRLDGELTGRWPAESLLGALANVENPYATDTLLCQNVNNTYDLLKGTVCASLDLAADRSKDRTDAPCEALSSALSFTAGKAILGHVSTQTKPDGGCPATTYDCSR
jgi:hypothetical protein